MGVDQRRALGSRAFLVDPHRRATDSPGPAPEFVNGVSSRLASVTASFLFVKETGLHWKGTQRGRECGRGSEGICLIETKPFRFDSLRAAQGDGAIRPSELLAWN